MKSRNNYYRCIFYGLGVVYILLILGRFFHLSADFPTDITSCRAMYSDEGWYAGNVINYFLTGNWHVPDEMNSYIALPVLQAFHFITFNFFGPTITAARLTILLFFLGILYFTYLITRHFFDNITAFVALFFLVTNYLSFAYSRFAIAEFPMTFFALLSIYLLLQVKEKHRIFLTVLSALSFMAALLTKTSAVFVLPILFYILWKKKKEGLNIRYLSIVFSAVAGLISLIYLYLLVFPHFNDYLYFYRLNIGIELDYSLGAVLNNAKRVLRRLRHPDRLFITILMIFTLYLSIKNRDFRNHPLFQICVLWLAFYLSQLFFYSRNVSRYYIPLYPVLSMLTGIVFIHLFQKTGFRLAKTVFLLALAVSLIFNVFRIGIYLHQPSYSFQFMASDIAHHMESRAESDKILLGYCSATVSLYNQQRYLNDLFTPIPLEKKIIRYSPQYYLTEGSDFDWIREDYSPVLLLLEKYYNLEKIAEYAVYQNIPTGRPMSLYSLKPREMRQDE